MSVFEELKNRGLVADATDTDELSSLLSRERVTFYIGYDPSAVSLHLGSLVPIVTMMRLQRAGHKPLALVGGATGMIGDPSGKSEERRLLDADTLTRNVEGLKAQLSRFLSFGDGPGDAVMVNNHDWFAPISYLEFLRDVGKHLTINYMMAKESVRARLEDRDQGISYTEFSYMLLQAYDFVELARRYNCRLQVGGSDQWGNITAGIELGRKLGYPHQLYGMTLPLLLDASGHKMGKTATGTRLWLDPGLTSPYALYQYMLNVEDADVERLLKIFSFRPLAEIAEIAREHAGAPEKRHGQRLLAEDVCTLVHDAAATRSAIAASAVMFGGSLAELRDADLAPLLADVPSSAITRAELTGGIPLLEMLARTGLASSKGAARRLVTGGGVYVNNVRAADPDRTLTAADLATESMLVLRAGKKNYHIVRAAE
jgi:tyrosyl-tRNA synthetase